MAKFEDVKLIINVELIPQTMWRVNLRSELLHKWNEIRKNVYKNADYKCEICGSKGDKHPVEAHELWSYDDDQKMMVLDKVIALCPMCHSCYHLGFASVQGKVDNALKHLQKINGFKDEKQMERYGNFVWETCRRRSKFNWRLDISKAKRYFN